MCKLVTGKKSAAQIIWNSPVFSGWFAQHVTSMEDVTGFGKRVRNLKAAKHRFESFSKPLARMALYLPAILHTMSDIAARRDTLAEGEVARSWLRDVTNTDFTLLGMLADAADECMVLVRLADDERGPKINIHACWHLICVSLSRGHVNNVLGMEPNCKGKLTSVRCSAM